MERVSDRFRFCRAAGIWLAAGLLLAACTSADTTLDPSSIKPEDTAKAPVAPAETTASAPAAAAPVIDSKEVIQLAPAVGPTVEAAKPLSARIAERARERGITLAGTTRTPTLTMKGYLSAITEAGQTTVIYVWDILDTGGNRLHRIQGQVKAAAGDGDGWSSVTAPTMEAIADRSVDELANWLSTRAS